MSLGRTHYCVRALIERGLVKVEHFRTSKNKLGYAYLLTPRRHRRPRPASPRASSSASAPSTTPSSKSSQQLTAERRGRRADRATRPMIDIANRALEPRPMSAPSSYDQATTSCRSFDSNARRSTTLEHRQNPTPPAKPRIDRPGGAAPPKPGHRALPPMGKRAEYDALKRAHQLSAEAKAEGLLDTETANPEFLHRPADPPRLFRSTRAVQRALTSAANYPWSRHRPVKCGCPA